MILCLVGNHQAMEDVGILKAKGEAIKNHLEEPLTQFAASEFSIPPWDSDRFRHAK